MSIYLRFYRSSFTADALPQTFGDKYAEFQDTNPVQINLLKQVFSDMYLHVILLVVDLCLQSLFSHRSLVLTCLHLHVHAVDRLYNRRSESIYFLHLYGYRK